MLPPGSPEPGPWRTSRVPFWRDIYASAADIDHDTVVVVCGAQMSKTEGLFNIIGHRFTDGPYVPTLYVGPTEKQVKSVSKDRVDKMLRSTPVLWQRTEKGQRYGVYEKWIAGIRLGFGWAGSATELSSHPAGLVVVDERDRMDADTGGEGDPVSLARARLKNYPSRKLIIASTPTIEGGSPIWSLWESGTMHMWAWRCVSCGLQFVPQLSLLKWPDGATPDEARESAYIECPGCKHMHRDREKARLNAGGEYVRHRKLRAGERCDSPVLDGYVVDGSPTNLKTASYWISGLASPWASVGDTAKVILDAYRSGEPERIQAEINTWGGELYRIRGDAPAWTEVATNRREYGPNTIVRGVQLITMGVDVQRSGLYYVIRGWGHMMESWLLDHDHLAGETEFDAVWQSLRNVIYSPVGDMMIRRVFIDSGFRPGDSHRRPDHAVYTFCRSVSGIAYPTKGQDSLPQPYTYKSIDYTVGGAVVPNGVRLYHLDTDYAKRWIHSRIRWPDGQPGGFNLHSAVTEDYCRQLVSEELVIKASGRATWIRKSRNNHYLDCEVNALMAALTLNAHRLADKPAAQRTGASPNQPARQIDAGSSKPARQGGYERRELY